MSRGIQERCFAMKSSALCHARSAHRPARAFTRDPSPPDNDRRVVTVAEARMCNHPKRRFRYPSPGVADQRRFPGRGGAAKINLSRRAAWGTSASRAAEGWGPNNSHIRARASASARCCASHSSTAMRSSHSRESLSIAEVAQQSALAGGAANATSSVSAVSAGASLVGCAASFMGP
jgi:hypothetical protein